MRRKAPGATEYGQRHKTEARNLRTISRCFQWDRNYDAKLEDSLFRSHTPAKRTKLFIAWLKSGIPPETDKIIPYLVACNLAFFFFHIFHVTHPWNIAAANVGTPSPIPQPKAILSLPLSPPPPVPELLPVALVDEEVEKEVDESDDPFSVVEGVDL